MTFEETCEDIKAMQENTMKNLASIEKRVEEIVNENNHLHSRTFVLEHELSLLKKENEKLKQDKDRLLDVILQMTKDKSNDEKA